MTEARTTITSKDWPAPLRWGDLDAAAQRRILQRSAPDDERVEATAQTILSEVAERGAAAIQEFGAKFDGVAPSRLLLGPKDFAQALNRIPATLRTALERAASNLNLVATQTLPPPQQKIEVEPGMFVTETTRPLARVGAYVPGGKAAYPSSVLMAAVPAKAAGVGAVIVATPPGADGAPPDAVLAACALAGVEACLVAGGAQAIAGLAFGIEGLSPVDKIVGPGNRYVTAAKKLVYGRVDIDSPAGPTEVVIVADNTTRSRWAALDLIAQAEHGEDSRCIVATSDAAIANQIAKHLAQDAPKAERAAIVAQALQTHGQILVFPTNQDVAAFVDAYAPEHLQIMSDNADAWTAYPMTAAATFIGNYTPVPAGDYLTGGNHVLPTGAAARWASPLSVHQFLVRRTVQELDASAASALADDLATIARAEGLHGHAKSMLARKGDHA